MHLNNILTKGNHYNSLVHHLRLNAQGGMSLAFASPTPGLSELSQSQRSHRTAPSFRHGAAAQKPQATMLQISVHAVVRRLSLILKSEYSRVAGVKHGGTIAMYEREVDDN